MVLRTSARRRALALEQRGHVGDGLAELGLHPAGHHLAVGRGRSGPTRSASRRPARSGSTAGPWQISWWVVGSGRCAPILPGDRAATSRSGQRSVGTRHRIIADQCRPSPSATPGSAQARRGSRWAIRGEALVAPDRGGDGGEHGVGAVDRRYRSAWSISTSIGGVSMARGTPNDRMVRSCTSPSSSTASALGRDPAERHVGGADGVGAQHDLVERVAARHPHPHRCTSSAPIARAVGPATPPSGRSTRIGSARRSRRRGRRRTAASAHPAARAGDRRRRAGDVDLLDHEAGRHRGDRARRCPGCAPRGRRRCRRPGCRPRRRALRPERTASSRESSTRTGRPCWSASSRAAAGDRRVDLAAEGAAVGQRRRRLAAGLAPRRVGLEVGRLDPRRAQGERPVAVGQLERRRGLGRRAPALHLARRRRRASASVSPTDPPARAVGHRHQRVGRGGVGGEAGPAQRHVGPDPLGRAALDARPVAHGGVEVPLAGRPAADLDRRSGRGPRRPRRRRPRRSCATRCTGTGGPAAPARRRRGRRPPTPLARRPSSRTMMPGVQNPHWLAPVATNASAHAVDDLGREAVEGGDGPAGHPADRGHAGDPGRAVDEHRAAAALALRAAAVLGAGRRRAGRAARRAATQPSSGTSTWRPSTTSGELARSPAAASGGSRSDGTGAMVAAHGGG